MEQHKSVLIIGHVFPEPKSSAAGKRMLQIIHAFLNQGFGVHFISSAKRTDFSEVISHFHYQESLVRMNTNQLDEILNNQQPDIVVYDRFMVYEQFGWKVEELIPNSFTILNTEDLHSLRDAREMALKAGQDVKTADFQLSEKWMREYSAIIACDYTWVVSDFEYDFLLKEWDVSGDRVGVLPIVAEPKYAAKETSKSLKMVMIGNVLHGPNSDSIQYTYQHIWSKILSVCPKSELHVYGAYGDSKQGLVRSTPKQVFWKGRTEDAIHTLHQYDILLAPLRFGAGIKGKILDAWSAGIPVITTPIGAEGMQLGSQFGGWIVYEPSEYAEIIGFLDGGNAYKSKVALGQKTLLMKFSKARFNEQFGRTLKLFQSDFLFNRRANILRTTLQFQSAKANKYFSRWIQLKEQSKRDQ